jgi:predicted DNA-binding mobile mystery protein A
MTARQLALRMSVAPSRIPTIEKAELTGATTLRTMRQVAAALDCAFVYALVPIEPLDEMLRDRAMKTAREDIARLNQTMRLENQALLTSDLDAERQRAIELILAGSLRGLWDEDHDRHA